MKIELWTDGACRGNGKSASALSGIGVVLLLEGQEPIYLREKLHFNPNTNNKAEIYAIIRGLDLLEEKYTLQNSKENFVMDTLSIYSDSAYTINGITQWINGWRANGWVNSKKEEVKNRELWEFLDNRLKKFKKYFNVEFVKVKGHAGNHWNEICDKLANAAMDGV